MMVCRTPPILGSLGLILRKWALLHEETRDKLR